ncbi:MAG: phosphotransferase family protein [Polyangiales bacterium]
MDDALAREITDVVARLTGEAVTVRAARPLAGGASMETLALDLTVGDRDEALVLRRDMAVNMFHGALSRADEFALLDLAHRRGVPCPRPRYLSSPDAPRRWFLMDRRPGESVGRKVVRDPALASGRARLASDLGAALAKVHALPTVAVTLPRPRDGRSPALEAIAQTRESIAALGFTRPSWAYLLRWLEQRAPACEALSVVHGDFRVGNVLVTPAGLEAVIDWEFAHLGDRHEDLAWPTLRDWRFGNDAKSLGGVGELDEFIDAYRAAGGAEVDRGALAWWQVAGNVRWAVMCHAQAERHLSGRDPSVELASLGRKGAEVEWEALRLIDEEERR